MNKISVLELTSKSILAGILITIGAAAIAMGNNVIGPLLYALAPLLIIYKGLYMFTGSRYCNENLSKAQMCYVFIINVMTVIVCASAIDLIRDENADVDRFLAGCFSIADYANIPFYVSFLLAIPAGAMYYLAFFCYEKYKNILLVIMPFIVVNHIGFEFILTDITLVILLQKDLAEISYLRLALVPIGNILGACLFAKYGLQAVVLRPKGQSDLYADDFDHQIAKPKAQAPNDHDDHKPRT